MQTELFCVYFFLSKQIVHTHGMETLIKELYTTQ
jgi:hypothetical protein